jgi:methionyl aminopeptidase
MLIVLKTREQIAGIRRSCQLAKQCLDMIEPYVVPGVETDELNARIAQFINLHGATSACLDYRGYPKETCISVNEVVCHGIPGNRQLQEGDILNIDVTTVLDGYYGDTSRMYRVGQISPDAERLLKTTWMALHLGIQQVRPGNLIGMIGQVITRFAESQGYGVVEQFVGHGVGLQFHEPPQVCHYITKSFMELENDEAVEMRPGMIFTIEPMINEGTNRIVVESDGWTAVTADRKLSAQYEHTVLVTDKGAEILTR